MNTSSLLASLTCCNPGDSFERRNPFTPPKLIFLVSEQYHWSGITQLQCTALLSFELQLCNKNITRSPNSCLENACNQRVKQLCFPFTKITHVFFLW